MLTKEQIRAKRNRDAFEKTRKRAFREIKRQKDLSKWEVAELLDDWEWQHKTCGKLNENWS